jgi:phosphoribosyl 1,2-cyclic phosphodiesterase
LRFCALASGSRGNALLVEHDETLIMIDCGLPLTVLESRLAAVDRCLDDLDAVLITHEHGDHSRGIGPLMRRRRIPLWTTSGTAETVGEIDAFERVRFDREITIGSIQVAPFAVPHDAREPCQFTFSAAGRRLGVLSDTGHATPVIRRSLAGCDALAIEFNHDSSMLEAGSYPESVKARVGSRFGHLSNGQASELLAGLSHDTLQWVMALHLSERNNSPERVREAAAGAIDGARIDFRLARQDEASPWLELA